MLEWVLPAPGATRLARVAQAPETPPALREALKTHMQPYRDASSSASLDGATAVRVPRETLVQVAQYGRAQHDDSLMLDTLLRNGSVYIPPLPKYERPKELDESLARIQRMHEEREYARMTERAQPYTVREARTRPAAAADEQERQAWRESREQISVIVNILLSVAAVATAAWWAAGNASPIWVRVAAHTESVRVTWLGAACGNCRGRALLALLAHGHGAAQALLEPRAHYV